MAGSKALILTVALLLTSAVSVVTGSTSVITVLVMFQVGMDPYGLSPQTCMRRSS